MEMNVEEMTDKETMECDIDSDKGIEDCGNRLCGMGYKNSTIDRVMALELEIKKKKSDLELFQTKFRALEAEKVAIEDDLRALKRRSELKDLSAHTEGKNKVDCGDGQGIKGIIDLTEVEDEEVKLVQLMIENSVLELEKSRAEREVEVWKKKYEELETWAFVLQKRLALSNKQNPLGRNEKLQLCSLNVDSHEGIVSREVNEAPKDKDGSDVGGSLNSLKNKVQVVYYDKSCSVPIFSSCTSPDTPSIDAEYKNLAHPKRGRKDIYFDDELKFGRRVRQQLSFEETECSNKKMAPSAPASVGVIHISDNDDEPDIASINMPTPQIQGSNIVCVPSDHALGINLNDGKEMTSKIGSMTISYQSDGEDLNTCKVDAPFASTPKRNKRHNIVTSDSDSDDDDDKVPIRKFKRLHKGELTFDPTSSYLNSCSTSATLSGVDTVNGYATPSKKRLMTLGEREKKGRAEVNSTSNLNAGETNHHFENLTNEDVQVSEVEEVGSESEGESLSGFIVSDSEVSGSGDGASSESEEVSDGNVDFAGIISSIQRNSDKNSKWEFEADMLAAFGKDPELCMRAVCALYRQQTSEEKTVKGTIYSNRRGFSQSDALRGSTLAEFLTDGDPQGDLKKSVKDLQNHHPKAPELCRTLATHYSKQLFAIYQNKEDPFFSPPDGGKPIE